MREWNGRGAEPTGRTGKQGGVDRLPTRAFDQLTEAVGTKSDVSVEA